MIDWLVGDCLIVVPAWVWLGLAALSLAALLFLMRNHTPRPGR